MVEISAWHPFTNSSRIKACALAATIKGCTCPIKAVSKDIRPPLRLYFFISRSGGERGIVSIIREAGGIRGSVDKNRISQSTSEIVDPVCNIANFLKSYIET
jgi:hypothetical protein